MPTLCEPPTEIRVARVALADQRPKLVHNRLGNERPQKRRHPGGKASEQRFILDGPLLVRNLCRWQIHRHRFDARITNRTSRHAN